MANTVITLTLDVSAFSPLAPERKLERAISAALADFQGVDVVSIERSNDEPETNKAER